MKLFSITILLLTKSVTADISPQECINQGGQIIGDAGNGAIFQPDYKCNNSGEAPTDRVVSSGGDAFAADPEVCCGGTGTGLGQVGNAFGEIPNGNNQGGCAGDDDCELIPCMIPPCPKEICVNGSCELEPNPPNPECVQDSDCPPINCFAAPCDVNVCNLGLCELQPPPEDNYVSEPNNAVKLTRSECTDELGGTIVGDIGNGAIFKEDYVCASNGKPPIGNVVPEEGEPIAVEGEVCCGSPAGVTRQECTEEYDGVIVWDMENAPTDYICESNGQPPIAKVLPYWQEGETLPTEGEVCCGPTGSGVTRQECSEKHGGLVVGDDKGDLAIYASNYVCESNGQPPIAVVLPPEGKSFIAAEGEVCCGPSSNDTTTNVEMVDDSTSAPIEPPAEVESTSGAVSANGAPCSVIVMALVFVLTTFVGDA